MEGRFVKRKGRTNEKFRYNRQCYEEEGKSTGRVVVRGRKNKRRVPGRKTNKNSTVLYNEGKTQRTTPELPSICKNIDSNSAVKSKLSLLRCIGSVVGRAPIDIQSNSYSDQETL